MRKIPIGIQDFKEIRGDDYYYVDKSDLIAQILDSKVEVYLFTRPRRFGKSLNLSMLDAFLNVKHKGNTWFDGLRVSERKDLEPRKNASPVLYFDFKDINSSTFDSFRAGMANKVADLYRLNVEVLEDVSDLKLRKDVSDIRMGTSDVDTLSRSLRILTNLMQDHHGRKVVVLIDEYDNPVHNAHGTEDFRKILDFMKIMLGSALKGNESLDLAVVIGVMQISKESIFSGFNNPYVNNIFSKESDEMFGFTPDEVRKLCADYGHPERYEEAKDWYDGYIFGDAEIYNPWSVLNYVKRGFEPSSYWAGTSGNSIIDHLLANARSETYDILRGLATGSSVKMEIDGMITFEELDYAPESIYSVMVMSGYLRAMHERSDHYLISIPNMEMYLIYSKMVAARLDTTGRKIRSLQNELVSGDAASVSRTIEDLLMTDMSFRILDDEATYQAYLIGLLFNLHDQYDIKAEREVGKGYCDILMSSKVAGVPSIVIELKRGDGASDLDDLAADAVRQIRDREYHHGLSGRVLLYGMAFHGKDARIVSEELDDRAGPVAGSG
ncbi:AAA family ATPase [Candidatus Methanoprimaticola sp. MG2]|uniref:AAA family ATPase n=1 Tax=Candidatus Methanoprimaticola sp. MG2 TaxID=3228838 RepID=UPI0039C5CC41